MKELTNRDQVGREGMPASLPPQSAFTYALSLAIEGAENKAVTFNKPIPVYVENFLGFPNGDIAPVGRFDPTTAQWVAENNGRVIRIASITAGQANLDIDATPGADDPTPLGVTTEERVALAARYPVGTSLWRFATSHFSLWDVNWGWGPPPTAEAPDNEAPESPDEDDPCEANGSIIECETQVLRESIAVTATPYSLVYSSARQPGSARRMHVPLTGAALPPDLQAIDVRIEVGGRTFTPTVPVTPNLTYEFVWDGLDVAGRRPSGPQPINTSVGYVYNGSYQRTERFGYNGNGTPISAAVDRFQATLFQYASTTLGTIDAAYAGLGGWTLDVHHVLDPQTGTVYLGNGKRKRGSSALTTFAGTGLQGHNGDGGPATAAALDLDGREGNAVAVSPAGDVYYTDGANYIRKIDTNGIITSIAGDGGATQLSEPSGIAIAPSGDIYIADSVSCRIRKLASSGALTTVAGAFLNFPSCVDRSTSSDGPADPSAPGAATFAVVRKLALAPDGTLYIAERTKLRRLRDGQVSTVASGFTQLYGVASAADGTLFVSDAAGKIHRIGSDGDVTVYAGGGTSTQDGIPATSAELLSPRDIAIGPDGLVYIAETNGSRIRRINGDGTIQTVAGTGVEGLGGDGHPTATQLNRPGGLTFGPDGALYIIDSRNHRIRKVSPKMGINLGGGAFGVASLDGQELFHFDASGRHLRTLDTHTGAAIHTFGYAGSALTSVTDVSGRVTSISRNGSTITLTAPDLQPTTLLLDGEQNLDRLTRPDGTFYTFDYAPGRLRPA